MKFKVQGLSVILDSNNNIRGAIFISAIYARFGIIKNAIFAYTLKASLGENNFVEEPFSIVPGYTYIDFGTDPDVKLYEYNNTVFVLEVNKILELLLKPYILLQIIFIPYALFYIFHLKFTI